MLWVKLFFLWTTCLFSIRLLNFCTLICSRSLYIIEIGNLFMIWIIEPPNLSSLFLLYDGFCHIEICFMFIIVKFWIFILWLLSFVSYFARTSLTPILSFLILSFLLVILWFYLYVFNLSEIYFGACDALLDIVQTSFFQHWAHNKHKCHLCLSLQYNLNQNIALKTEEISIDWIPIMCKA